MGRIKAMDPQTLLRVKMRFSAFTAAITIPLSALMRSIAPKAGKTIRPVGAYALYSTTDGEFNTAIGSSALYSNTTGEDNTAIGSFALGNYRGVGDNTAMGAFALSNLSGGNRNIALGSDAGENLLRGGDNIYIGNPGVGTEVGIIRIGVKGTHVKAFIAGINGSSITGTTVVVNSYGRLGTVASSQRFKDDIKPMDKASEAILALSQSLSIIRKRLIPMGSRSLASWLRTWKRSILIWWLATLTESPTPSATRR